MKKKSRFASRMRNLRAMVDPVYGEKRIKAQDIAKKMKSAAKERAEWTKERTLAGERLTLDKEVNKQWAQQIGDEQKLMHEIIKKKQAAKTPAEAKKWGKKFKRVAEVIKRGDEAEGEVKDLIDQIQDAETDKERKKLKKQFAALRKRVFGESSI